MTSSLSKRTGISVSGSRLVFKVYDLHVVVVSDKDYKKFQSEKSGRLRKKRGMIFFILTTIQRSGAIIICTKALNFGNEHCIKTVARRRTMHELSLSNYFL